MPMSNHIQFLNHLSRLEQARRDIQVVESIEDISPIPSMLLAQESACRSGRFGLVVAIRQYDYFSPGVSLLELDKKVRCPNYILNLHPELSFEASVLRNSRDGPNRVDPLNISKEEAYGSLRNAISSIKASGLSNPLVKEELASKVTSVLTHSISSTKYNVGKNSGDSIFEQFPKTTKDMKLLSGLTHQQVLAGTSSSGLIQRTRGRSTSIAGSSSLVHPRRGRGRSTAVEGMFFA
ncbi:hypothetical protein ACFE04_001670 [Oxalis oulophora]